MPRSIAVKLQLTQPLRLNYTGPVTGKVYCFDGGGSIVDVDKADADVMILKMTTGGCCENPFPPQPYFEIVR